MSIHRNPQSHRRAANLDAASTRIPVFAGQFGSWRLSLERDPLGSDDLIRIYGGRAANWPRMLQRWGFSQAYADLARRLVNLEPGLFRARARVLDGGAGSGALSLALARASPVALRHDLLDLSPAMLAVAGQILRAAGVRPSLLRGDIGCLPYADDTFDLTVAAHVLEHLADPLPALRELRRVTKASGRVLLIVTRQGCIGKWLQLAWRVHCATEPQLLEWLARSGLSWRRFLALESPWWCDRASLVCVAAKAASGLGYGVNVEGEHHEPYREAVERVRTNRFYRAANGAWLTERLSHAFLDFSLA